MKKNFFLAMLFLAFSCAISFAQNGIIGSGFGTNDWSTTDNFIGSAGDSRIAILSANGTGNSYFRLVTNWDSNYNQWGPSSTSDDYLVTNATDVPNTEIVENSTSKAYYINTNSSYNYVFKTKQGGNPPSNLGYIIFEVQGLVRNVSSVTTSSITYPGQTNTITATLDGSLSAGQGVYLRYSTDNFSTSTVMEMIGSGTSYTADIPSGTNTIGTTVNYYLFTSGDGLTISPENADYYTINLNNNIGTNYNYTVESSYTSKADGNWSDTNTWMDGTIPETSESVVINNNVTLDQNQEIASLEVNSSLSINSGISLIVNGTSTGNVTYNQTLGSTNWYLMSSPVSGVNFNDDFVTNNNIDDNGTGDNRGVASYTTDGDTWSYLETGSMTSTSGVGYSVKQDVAGNVAFSGTINTGNITPSISFAGNGFNLLGNPYTSHINSKTFLDANSNLDQTQLWIWNQSLGATGMYEVKTNANAFMLAPTQGFFVKANSGTQVNFDASNQVVTGGTFQKTQITELKLLMTNGKSNRFAKIYYSNNATNGFDSGYEGEVFGGIPNSLDVFTNLVSENEGKKYQVQSLPNTNYESMVIPVGIIADAGEITFSAEAMNLPAGLKVFLEDRNTNTFTRLDEANSSYKVTLTEKTDDIGRFYLHTKSSALSSETVALENVSIYNTDKSTLRIVGLSQGKSTIKMFNVLGKQVLNSTFNSNGVSEINVSQLSTGIYIVQLENEAGSLNKKIVLE